MVAQSGGFQSIVNNQPAPAVGGDFLSSNPRVSEVGGPGAWVSPVNGIVVNAFAWIANSGTADVLGSISQPTAAAPATTAPQAFVGRQGQMSLWYALLQQSGLTIPQGYPVTLYNQGEFWMGGPGLLTTAAQGGQKIFASTTTPGQIATGTAGTPMVDASVTGSIANTGVFTVTAVGSGALAPGMGITGTGVPANTFIQSQLSGTTGGIGTYQVNTTTVVASETITGSAHIETRWYVQSGFQCNAGELVAATSWGP